LAEAVSLPGSAGACGKRLLDRASYKVFNANRVRDGNEPLAANPPAIKAYTSSFIEDEITWAEKLGSILDEAQVLEGHAGPAR